MHGLRFGDVELQRPGPSYATGPEAAMTLHHRDETGREGFRWFSERVDECLALPGIEALGPLRDLIADAAADKLDGCGPSQHDIEAARRKWLDRYAEVYGRAA
jgi:hypothetical protein